MKSLKPLDWLAIGGSMGAAFGVAYALTAPWWIRVVFGAATLLVLLAAYFKENHVHLD